MYSIAFQRTGNSCKFYFNIPGHCTGAMEKTCGVEFRNVGSYYFPQSRVDCHYTITQQHTWASNDWIGLFKVMKSHLLDIFAGFDVTVLVNYYLLVSLFTQVGWSSVKDYHTFVWAVAPSSYKEGTSVNCCVNFQGLQALILFR